MKEIEKMRKNDHDTQKKLTLKKKRIETFFFRGKKRDMKNGISQVCFFSFSIRVGYDNKVEALAIHFTAFHS